MQTIDTACVCKSSFLVRSHVHAHACVFGCVLTLRGQSRVVAPKPKILSHPFQKKSTAPKPRATAAFILAKSCQWLIPPPQPAFSQRAYNSEGPVTTPSRPAPPHPWIALLSGEGGPVTCFSLHFHSFLHSVLPGHRLSGPPCMGDRTVNMGYLSGRDR